MLALRWMTTQKLMNLKILPFPETQLHLVILKLCQILLLEVVADTVYSNDGIKKEDGGRRNEHVLRRLLEQLHTTMAIYHVWGSPFLGGGHLIKQHRDTRQKITGFVEKMQVRLKTIVTNL